MAQKFRNIRIGMFCFLLLAVFVLKPPSKDSLEESSATVLSARQLLTRFDVEYSLANGTVLKENFKSSQIIQGDTSRPALLQLQGTNEKITVWHKNGKVWQIQKPSGEFILKFEDIQKRRFVCLSILAAGLLLVGIFLPSLIKEK